MGKGLITVRGWLQHCPFGHCLASRPLCDVIQQVLKVWWPGVLLSPLAATVLVEFALGFVKPSWGLYRSYLYVLSPLSPPVSDPGVCLQDFQVSQPCEKDWETHGPSTFSPNHAPRGAEVSCWHA